MDARIEDPDRPNEGLLIYFHPHPLQRIEKDHQTVKIIITCCRSAAKSSRKAKSILTGETKFVGN